MLHLSGDAGGPGRSHSSRELAGGKHRAPTPRARPAGARRRQARAAFPFAGAHGPGEGNAGRGRSAARGARAVRRPFSRQKPTRAPLPWMTCSGEMVFFSDLLQISLASEEIR